MKKRLLLSILFGVAYLFIAGHSAHGQDHDLHAANGMTAHPANYTWFTHQYRDISAEVLQGNIGYETHPEVGMLFAETPCDNCYEVIEKRTEKGKFFVKKGTEGKELMQQSSSMSMHYRDASGNWRTIKAHLEPDVAHSGVYAAYSQPAPVCINTTGKFSTLGVSGQKLQFNNALQLIYLNPAGVEVPLGAADWSHFTAGDDGVYITNAWPGVDVEMHAVRGAIKTNFIINHALPAYADGKLLVRDHLAMDEGMTLYSSTGNTRMGNLEVLDNTGELLYAMSAATACEMNNARATMQLLEYNINGSVLDISLPGNFLNRPEHAYPVMIDPLVSVATSVTASGSTYSPTLTTGCVYPNAATTPANCAITDIQWSFSYITSGGALLPNGWLDFITGTCRSPGFAGYYWTCNTPVAPGTCDGIGISIFADPGSGSYFNACIGPPQCLPYDLNIRMDFYQNYASTAACATTYISGAEPYIITVFGHTVDANPVTILGGSATICAGQTVSLSDTGVYGIPPYTYSWSPGGYTTEAISVSPAATTIYTVTVTDACGNTATTTQEIDVNPVSPISGPTTVCIGNSITLTDGISGGTWSSGAPGTASVNSSTGVVTGSAVGTAMISYTNPSGCVTTYAISVTGTPGPITGSTTICSGSSTTLHDSPAGGTWSDVGGGFAASVDPVTGVVTGTGVGATTVTYSLGASCYATVIVNILALPVITGFTSIDPTSCVSSDGSITISGLTPGTMYTVNYLFNGTPVATSGTADAGGFVTIFGLTGGSYTNFSVTDPAGCTSVVLAGPVVLAFPPTPATPVATNTSPVCAGNAVSFTATTVSGATYNWTGPGGFTTTLQNPGLAATTTANSGTYSVTVTVLGCVSLPGTTVVTINPVPAIAAATSSNPTMCLGSDGTITLSGLVAGVSYTVSYTANGVPVTTTITANGSGDVIITGLSAGVYDHVYVISFGCQSAEVGPVILLDPGSPAIPVASSNSPVCVGAVLALFASDSTANITYSWAGPAGFTSTDQNPVVYNVPATGAGVYTVTVSTGACFSSSSTTVVLFPPITLINVTPSQAIPYGSSIQLFADGALYYVWSPNDGTLSDANIRNPVVTPKTTTTYIITGTSINGCLDSASVTITVVDSSTAVVPDAFTPNGDGRNDIFRIVNIRNRKLVDFSIFNRWGELVYHNGTNIHDGWDGTWNGQPQDIGTYSYSIILAQTDGENVTYKGTVTLLR